MAKAPSPTKPSPERIAYAAAQLDSLTATMRTHLKTLRDAGEGIPDALYYATEAGTALNQFAKATKLLAGAVTPKPSA